MEIKTILNMFKRTGNIPELKFAGPEQEELFTGKLMENGNFHTISEKKSYTPKLDLAIEYLKANPDTTLSNRKIAEELGISHPVVAQAKEILKNG